MNWNNASNNFKGKTLKSMVRIDEDTILLCDIYYRPDHVQKTNKWGVKWNENIGKYLVTLHVSKMIRNEYAYTGGIGVFVTVHPEPVERRTLKLLETVANDITEKDVLKLGGEQSGQPSTIVPIAAGRV